MSRALRRHLDGEDHQVINEAIEDALSRIAERPIAADVVSLARRIGPNVLRSLEAILVDADVVITYDERLTEAARHNDVTVSAPSPKDRERLRLEMARSTGEEGDDKGVQQGNRGAI